MKILEWMSLWTVTTGPEVNVINLFCKSCFDIPVVLMCLIKRGNIPANCLF